MSDDFPRRASLEVLRAEAADERSVLVHERLRFGEDPWDFMSELPTTDELVVLLLRADVAADQGGTIADRGWNDGVLRRIALEYPELSPTVWRMLAA
ncbi:tryptophan synthase subunit alpha [Microbacterium esteraromaticum]|uniref:Tryptophan synthase subunit alpha n=1 Tax=Microbacterium esteraromaticum TaxID=57043 RepID=A0A939IS06_9MICO|nr:tryptophan synthase subunit alpha [Microbacterium esteraromaticum]MBN7794025.1 tryptophan synthase subunit alpha [Microbacterium esteraromaticum]MBN8204682.1 tryptophan synthase subunit alpha [Microbacterium esteraromaticum]MBN8414836.1 tryptophan synthase subunit alpha [Microbacterium esteraromaticum]MBN8424889.1 tryptophan synthase subunit alpha [Microbacterium esteraromaticum]MBY6061820.1 tryptophan synthase subunit alpha [Microbacterium esteraromaticum]